MRPKIRPFGSYDTSETRSGLIVPGRVSWLFSRTSGETGVRRCRRSVLALLLRKSVRPGRFAQAAVQPKEHRDSPPVSAYREKEVRRDASPILLSQSGKRSSCHDKQAVPKLCAKPHCGRRPQHFLYFFPLPQGQGSLRPVLDPAGRAETDAGVDLGGVCAVLESYNDEESFHRPQYEML